MIPGGGIRLISAAAAKDFPAPDSPTIPSLSPAAREKETSESAGSAPSSLGNWTDKLLTCKRVELFMEMLLD